jgi:AcrR family transcriptional regulator
VAGRGAAGRATVDPDRILELALDLAEEAGFDGLRLSAVAERAGVPPAEVARLFPDTNAVADAWFARALAAVWATPAEALDDPDPAVRLERVIVRWLDALAPRRALTGRMLAAKLWPSHPHHWVPMLFDLSRLVHAFLDMARVPGAGPERAAQEIGATALLLGTLAVWLADPSQDQRAARGALRRGLAAGVGLLRPLSARRRGG